MRSEMDKVRDEAIIAINEAISINPDYEYFRNQKEKFLESND